MPTRPSSQRYPRRPRRQSCPGVQRRPATQRHRLLPVAAATSGLVLVLALAACGGGAASGSRPAPTADQAAAGSGHAANPAPSVSSAHGLVVCQLVDNDAMISLEVISPSTGAMEAATTISAMPGQQSGAGYEAPAGCSSGGPMTVHPTDNIPAPGPEQFAAREEFNADFTELAVLIPNSASGGADAGYLNLSDGDVTDLSKASESGFGSSPVTDDLFDPTTGSLWYLAGSTVYSVTASGQAIPHPVSYSASFGIEVATQGLFTLAPGTSWVLPGNALALPNPSGTVAVGPPGPNAANPNGVLEEWPQGSDVTDGSTGTVVSVSALADTQGVQPIAWLSDTRLLIQFETSSGWNFAVLTFSPGYTAATMGPDLLPASSYQFYDAVLSPTGSTLAFIVNQGGSADYLYELALGSPGAQPSKIAALGSTSQPYALLAWR